MMNNLWLLQASNFFFKENKDYPDTKTDLFRANQMFCSNGIEIKESVVGAFITTFDIKMPENDGYHVTIDEFDKMIVDSTSYKKDENNRSINLVLNKEYDIGLPYFITIMSDPTKTCPYMDCDIAIYTDSNKTLEESLIRNYTSFLKLGIIVIKDMDRYYSSNSISYKYNDEYTTYDF